MCRLSAQYLPKFCCHTQAAIASEDKCDFRTCRNGKAKGQVPTSRHTRFGQPQLAIHIDLLHNKLHKYLKKVGQYNLCGYYGRMRRNNTHGKKTVGGKREGPRYWKWKRGVAWNLISVAESRCVCTINISRIVNNAVKMVTHLVSAVEPNFDQHLPERQSISTPIQSFQR